VELLGFGSDAIRIVPVDADYRMDAAALDRAIGEDVAAGARPVAVVASAGTVNTGAIDPIEDIASVCARRGVWLHVDAAYGGPAILTHEYRSQLAPLALADSVALDPHKWMYVPVETGFVMVRDAAAMRDTFSLVPPYIRSHGSSSAVMGLPWFSEYGFQQTRGFRALKVWMCLKYFGLAGYKDAVERDIALARYLADRIRRTAELELLAPPSLSVVCFRYAGRAGAGVKDGTTAGADEGRLDALNRSVLERLQVGGEAFITSTELGGRFALRACIVNHRSMPTDMDRMIDVIVALGRDA
jgi:glutamate/tyrosine decarboxylase-like PLP-dependent enzyme